MRMRDPQRAEQVAELAHIGIRGLVANDAERSSFSVMTTNSLLLISGDDLTLVHEWKVGAEPAGPFDGWGNHSASADGPVALLCTPDAVRMLEPDDSVRWSFHHASWVGIGSGCAWFDANGMPFAVVAAGDGTRCKIVSLDLASGVERAAIIVEANDPAAMWPVHQPGGWVGVSETEGENASRAWWVRTSSHELEVLSAPWDDEQLNDVDDTGSMILTSALDTGRIRIRSFPSLQVVREIDVEGENFIFGACFVGSGIVARLYYRQVTVVIDEDDRIQELAVDDGGVAPSAAGTWLSVGSNTLRRWALV